LDVRGRNTKVERVEVCKKKFLGKDVKALKIFATNYKDLHEIADHLDIKGIVKRRGYDLGFVTHYIIERKLRPLQWYEVSAKFLTEDDFGGVCKNLDVGLCIKAEEIREIEKKDFSPKVLAYDIETDDFRIGKGEILMISLVDDDFRKVITWKKNPGKNVKQDFVEYVDSEEELLEKFVKYVKKLSPDFLVGYFSDGFDLPYLRARADRLKVPLTLGLDNSRPRFHKGILPTGRLSGIVHVDLLKFIQTAYSQYMQ
jgi:DNA polymerase I